MIVGLAKFDEGDTTMAEVQRMTAREAADKVMALEHADVLRESVALMVREVMELEVARLAGAEHGERAPGQRLAQRNGYRERRWDTRVGEIELAIPRLRTGSYLPSFLEPRRRAEQAVVQEAYVNGVSTRKVDRLVEQMGLRGLSKDQVSRMCQGLDEQVQAFRQRPLEGAYPYLWLDAKVERVRERGGVRQKALVIAYAVHETGVREVLRLDVGEAETEAFWTEFLFSLKARGLAGVRLCVSDAHQGLRNAIARVLGCRWQRCTVHFLRDMLGHCARQQQPMIATAIRQLFNADSGAEARERLTEVVERLEGPARVAPLSGCRTSKRAGAQRVADPVSVRDSLRSRRAGSTGSAITARSLGRSPHRQSRRSPSGPRRARRAGS
jgi:putative transposase